MTQTTAKVSGMACSMCEAQINDTIRTAFPIEKVSSSHSQGETVIHSKEPLNENTLRAAIEATGYTREKSAPCPMRRKPFSILGKNTKLIPVPALLLSV